MALIRSVARPPWPSASDRAAPTTRVEPEWTARGADLLAALEGGRDPDVRRPGLTVYQAVQHDAPWLGEVVLDVARALDRPVAVNLYHARGGGFPRHWDAHDSVILQISGARVWSLEPRQGSLRRSPEDAHPPAVEAETRTFTLEAGTAVRFPAGWWHQGSDAGSHSAHLTFALGPFDQGQWLRWITERPEAAFSPAFSWTVGDAHPGRVALSWPGGRVTVNGACVEVARRIHEGPFTSAGNDEAALGLATLAAQGLVRPVAWLAGGDADT